MFIGKSTTITTTTQVDKESKLSIMFIGKSTTITTTTIQVDKESKLRIAFLCD